MPTANPTLSPLGRHSVGGEGEPRDTYLRVMEGGPDCLPPRESNILRVFLSSTFTDFTVERNFLMKDAIERLQNLGRQLGCEFQVADMRWGVRDEAQQDHNTSALCLQEIDNCRRMSRGPYFVSFLGNKYGFRPYPSTIEASEFELIRKAANTAQKDTSLLRQWFRRDDNTRPPSYVLQPITERLSHYNDQSDEGQEQRAKDEDEWSAVNSLLSTIFRSGADTAHKHKRLSQARRHDYFKSVTEAEVERASLSVSAADANRTLCFVRHLEDIDHTHKGAGRFMDLDSGQPDSEAAALLEDLTSRRVPAALPAANIYRFRVPWAPGGIDPGLQQHADYLTSMSEAFYDRMREELEAVAAQGVADGAGAGADPQLYQEVLHHAHFAAEKRQGFCGRSDVIDKVKGLLVAEFVDDQKQENGETKKMDDKKESDIIPGKTSVKQCEEHSNNKIKVDVDHISEADEDDADKLVASDSDDNSEASADEDMAESITDDEVKADNGDIKPDISGKSKKDAAREEELNQIHQMMDGMGVSMAAEEAPISGDDMKVQETILPALPRLTTRPVILHGVSGSGKTSLMAELGRLIPAWIREDRPDARPVCVQRYLGTSPETGALRPALVSVLRQLWAAYPADLPPVPVADLQRDPAFLVAYFHSALRRIDSERRPLVLLLDAVDQLSPEDGAASLGWLPPVLPPSVHVVVSLLPERVGGLRRARRLGRLVEVPGLPRDTVVTMLDQWLGGATRGITAEQRSVVLEAVRLCPQPLFLRTAFEHSQQWRSYTPPDEWQVGLSMRGAVDLLFVRLEREHGQTLVSKALGYLTVAKRGLTDAELEDVLSCDDVVLQDTYLYHLPPDPQSVRLPPLLWRRVHHALSASLVTQRVEGRNVVTWYHRQFAEAAASRYARPPTCPALHAALADYFSGRWGGARPKPLRLYKKKQGEFPAACRGVPEQPLCFSPGVYNRRALSELPHHLLRAGRYDQFLHSVASDFEFLYAKTRASGVTAVLGDLKAALDAVKASGGTGAAVEADLPVATATENGVTTEHSQTENEGEGQIYLTQSETAQESVRGEQQTATQQDVEGDREGGAGGPCHKDEETGENTCQAVEGTGEEMPTDPESLEQQIRCIRDVLVLAADSVSQNVNNLALQLLGQLGAEDVEGEAAGVRRLRAGAARWARGAADPLLVPRGRCLPAGGGEVIADITAAICFPGDEPKIERKLSITKDGSTLYVVSRHSDGDVMREYDLTDAGAPVTSRRLAGEDVKWMELVGGDKYMYMEIFMERDNFTPKYERRLVNASSHLAVSLPKGYSPLAVSPDGAYCLLQHKDSAAGVRRPLKAKAVAPGEETLYHAGMLYSLDGSREVALRLRCRQTQPIIMHALFSPDSHQVALLCRDRRTYIYDTVTGKLKFGFGMFVEQVFDDGRRLYKESFKFVGNHILLVPDMEYDKYNLHVYDCTKGQLRHELQGHIYEIDLIAVSKSLQLVASATSAEVVVNGRSKKFVRVWDIEQGKEVSVIPDEGPHRLLTFLGDSDELLVDVSDEDPELLSVWYVGEGGGRPEAVCVHRLVGHSKPVVWAGLAPGNGMLVTAAEATVKLWSLVAVERTLSSRLGGEGGVQALRDRRQQGEDTPTAPGEGAIVSTAMAVSADGTMAAVGTQEGWVIFYDLRTTLAARKQRVGGAVSHLMTSRSGTYTVSVGADVHVWDPRTGKHVREIHARAGASCVAESCDIIILGYGGMECSGQVYKLDTGEHMQALQGLYGFSKVVITSDASKVVTTIFDYPMVFELSGGQPWEMGQPDTMMAGCTCLSLSPNDRYVCSCSSDGSVRVMDLRMRKYCFRMQHRSTVSSVCFTRDSRHLVTAGFRNILVWSLGDGRLTHTLSRHQNFIQQLQLVCNDRFLVSCASDKLIVVWDFTSKHTVAAFQAHCPVEQVVVAADLGSVLFLPRNVAYLGLLQPNPALQRVAAGARPCEVPDALKQAQAFALAFSSQKVAQQSSRACIIL